MNKQEFDIEVKKLLQDHEDFLSINNKPVEEGNGIYSRYKNPVITPAHVPVEWRYDLDYETNPFLMERLGVNATFNSGAIEAEGKVLLCVRVEGYDRKSFFGIAESETGVDKFKFREYPMVIPETENPDINVYDMRLVKHEDGMFYGLFCTERKDPDTPLCDTSSAIAQCGIVRSKDLETWERLPDLVTKSPQQRNVVLHPEFIDGKYAFYTRPQDGFIDAGSGGGIGWGLSESIENAVIENETIIDDRIYHTIKEVKNGLGPAPIKTDKGWLQLAHGVRNTAAGLRYVLYMFMTDLQNPDKIIAKPGGHFLSPHGQERVGDVSNVVFSNGWVKRSNGSVLIYYGSSDTLMHVAVTTLDKLIDYVFSTSEDPLRSAACVQQRIDLINKNKRMGG